MINNYWPWWLGGGLLAAVAILYPLLNGAPLGVSGALARLLRWRSEGQLGPQIADSPSGTPQAAACGDPASGTNSQSTRRIGNLLFLIGILVGGALAGRFGGQPWGTRAQLSPEFYRLFGSGFRVVWVLFGGGVLVGFGTRWSGGCTSGHGLSGCGRLQPPSLIATGVFFGVAIATSFLLERLLS